MVASRASGSAPPNGVSGSSPRRGQEDPAAHARAAQLVLRHAQADADQEAAQRVAVAQLVDAGEEAQEDLLAEVLAVGARAEVPPQEAQHQRGQPRPGLAGASRSRAISAFASAASSSGVGPARTTERGGGVRPVMALMRKSIDLPPKGRVYFDACAALPWPMSSRNAAIQASGGVPVDGHLVGRIRLDVVDVAGLGRAAAHAQLADVGILERRIGAARHGARAAPRAARVLLVRPDAVVRVAQRVRPVAGDVAERQRVAPQQVVHAVDDGVRRTCASCVRL